MKRKKLTRASDIPVYHSINRGAYNGYQGYFYSLTENLSKETEKDIMKRYNNVAVLSVKKGFAPEIKQQVIFVSEKVIK